MNKLKDIRKSLTKYTPGKLQLFFIWVQLPLVKLWQIFKKGKR